VATPLPGGLQKEPLRKQLFPCLFTRLEWDSRVGAGMLAFALSKFLSMYVDDWIPGPIKSQVQSGIPGLSISDSKLN
jgi:hypothetical protein